MIPTAEQTAARDAFTTGGSVVVSALAGTGKTATLALLAESTGRRGQYLAFNRALINDAAGRFPDTIAANTVHSLAFRAVGKHYKARLDNSRRMSSMDIARILRVEAIDLPTGVGHEKRRLSPGFLAGHVMRGVDRFCQSADPAPTGDHVPYVDGLDLPDGDGRKGWANNRELRRYLAPFLTRAWLDLCQKTGQLRFSHACYLKMWELSGPVVDADYLLWDEVQDSSKVMESIVLQQDGTQVVAVGDAQQAIYGWMGAIDALTAYEARADATATLTQSFRSGHAVAEVANALLEQLGTDLRLRGHDGIDSEVVTERLERPAAVLCRTNAVSVRRVISHRAAGQRVALVGDGSDVLRFARAAQELQQRGSTSHPDLACFADWPSVQQYCLAPETRVLTSDLRWQPIELLGVGDALVGFDEIAGPGTNGRRYVTSHVTSAKRLVRPCWKVTMEDGTSVVSSVEHLWLIKYGRGNLHWRRTDSLRPGSEIASLGPSWVEDESKDAGWLAGMIDGEGCLSKGVRGSGTLVISQKEGPVCERLRSTLKERGFTFSDGLGQGGVMRLTISGGIAEKLRLLGEIRPGRLLAVSSRVWEGGRVEARVRSTVRSVEQVGERDVIALGTTSRTFIAEGMLSHNCVADALGGELRLLVNLVDEFGVPVIESALSGLQKEATAEVVVSTAHKAKGRQWSSVALADDFPVATAEKPLEAEELRLQYVAVTRAQHVLDVSACPTLAAIVAPTTRGA